MTASIKNNDKNQKRFGSFAGVFTPNALTILGLILFLRTGWTVGHAGLIGALIIIGLANTISLLTGLSISAIATNMQVKAGGAYYMISRSLGLEIGGAIGIPLYLSQATSVAFYIIGFSEALNITYPAVPARELSIALVVLFGILAYIGAHFIIKVQFVILAILGVALLSFFTGTSGDWVAPAWFPDSGTTTGFWDVFAVFFPAVTGIMVGVSMSGDLVQPGRDIPRGTLSAVGVTAVIYAAAAVWLSLHAAPEALRSDTLVMQNIARWPQLILLGVWASTLSSALGSAMAAPRTLQALSFDRIVPRFVGTQLGSASEPRTAVIITTGLALTVVFLGQLNFVAKLITMFFLNTYGMINITAGLESLIGNPSFRPRFKVSWVFSLLGGIGCYSAMLLIHPTATVVAVLFSYGIFFFLKHRSIRQRWGDLRTGLWVALVRTGLLHLQRLPDHSKNWRPNIVAFTGTPGTEEGREHLMQLAVWLSRGGGIVTLSHLLVGSLDELAEKEYRQTSRNRMLRYIEKNGAEAFGECTIVPEFYQGVTDIAQAHGVVNTSANTVLLGWAHDPGIQERQLQLARDLMGLNKSILFLKYSERHGYGKQLRIDIWWRGRDLNAQLMLMLAHIICQDKEWECAKIRLLRFLDNERGLEQTEAYTREFIDRVRVDALPVILTRQNPNESFKRIFMRTSQDADLVIAGLPKPRPGEFHSQARKIRNILQHSPSTLLVRCAESEDIMETESIEP